MAACSESIGQLIAETCETISSQGACRDLIATGWPDLDEQIDGLQRGQVGLVAAGHGMGKTAFGLQLARQVSNCSVLYFAGKLSKQILTSRILAGAARINIDKLKAGNLTEAEWVSLSVTIAKLNEAQIDISIPDEYCLAQIAIEAARSKQLDLLIIDDLEMLLPATSPKVIAEILHGLKVIAKQLNIAVLLLSSLTVSLDKRKNPRPLLSDLLPLGISIELLDKVIFMHRDDCYAHLERNYGITELAISHQVSGPIGATVRLCLLKESLELETIVCRQG